MNHPAAPLCGIYASLRQAAGYQNECAIFSIAAPNDPFPLKDYDGICFIKNVVKNPGMLRYGDGKSGHS
jgi:hypothetical protein